MRRFLKNNIVGIFKTVYEAHEIAKDYIDIKEFDNARNLYAECQVAAMEVGNLIEELEGDGLVTIGLLEEYCESLFEVSQNISKECVGYEVKELLDKKLQIVENSVEKDIRVKLEIVFMPYKASMWDSLESIWKVAEEDDDCEAYVVPIPYYDRNSNGTTAEYHYEGGEYPDYVPIVHYEEYNLKQRRPDIIYIHNPYDNYNYVTSVDPRFYSSELKKYTDCLVYVPYFLFPKLATSNLINTPALFNVDYIFVQNEKVREAYINEIKNYPHLSNGFENKIFAIGTPKTDKVFNICKKGIEIPEHWKRQSLNKKKLFLNTNISLILHNNELFIENMSRIFAILNQRKDVFVIWREHPLTNETLKAMKPEMFDEYEKLKFSFLESGLGVLDTNVEPYKAICFSDCYFGAGGSLIPIYAVTGKPMLTTAYIYPDNITNKEVDFLFLKKQSEKSINFSERYKNSLSLFLDNLENLMQYKDKRFKFLSEITDNVDGTVGKRIMLEIKKKLS